MGQTPNSGQIVTDHEVEAARLMLRIAADIERLDALTDTNPRTRLSSTNQLAEQGENLRSQVEQAARFTGCPVLNQLLAEPTKR